MVIHDQSQIYDDTVPGGGMEFDFSAEGLEGNWADEADSTDDGEELDGDWVNEADSASVGGASGLGGDGVNGTDSGSVGGVPRSTDGAVSNDPLPNLNTISNEATEDSSKCVQGTYNRGVEAPPTLVQPSDGFPTAQARPLA